MWSALVLIMQLFSAESVIDSIIATNRISIHCQHRGLIIIYCYHRPTETMNYLFEWNRFVFVYIFRFSAVYIFTILGCVSSFAHYTCDYYYR